jgi:hypothetical protein
MSVWHNVQKRKIGILSMESSPGAHPGGQNNLDRVERCSFRIIVKPPGKGRIGILIETGMSDH